jgi:Uncharacterized ACR, COG1993
MKLEGTARMLRIHFGEDDKWKDKPLYRAIVEKCRELDIAGATVFRGIEGYGASTLIRRPRHMSFSHDAPVSAPPFPHSENPRCSQPAHSVCPQPRSIPANQKHFRLATLRAAVPIRGDNLQCARSSSMVSRRQRFHARVAICTF